MFRKKRPKQQHRGVSSTQYHLLPTDTLVVNAGDIPVSEILTSHATTLTVIDLAPTLPAAIVDSYCLCDLEEEDDE